MKDRRRAIRQQQQIRQIQAESGAHTLRQIPKGNLRSRPSDGTNLLHRIPVLGYCSVKINSRRTLPMITRLIPVLLLGSSFFIPLPAAWAVPTIQLIVPSYDYTPGNAFATIAQGIANDGTVAGAYSSIHVPEASYTRLTNGRFSRPIIVPGGSFTTAFGINNSGVVIGTFISDATHGFFFDGTTYTQFDLPGYANTYIFGENDAGDFVGVAIDAGGVDTGYISVGGVITTFTIPGASEVDPRGINSLGQVAGYYFANSIQHGFFRDADGTLTYPIDFPGARTTTIFGLNDRGSMVGTYGDLADTQHAFVLRNGTRFVPYDHPDGSATFFAGVNNSGFICGYYSDTSGSSHAFIARIEP